MSRILMLALIALAALLVGAAPASAATAPAPPAAHAATLDDCDPDVDPDCDAWEDDEDWDAEDPGDEGCYEEWDDDLGEWVAVEGSCDEDDFCLEDDEWGDDEDWDDDELASAATSGGDDDEDLCEDAWDEDEGEGAAVAPRVSKLRATPSRHGRGGRVEVRFRLDRAGRVELRLERVGAGASRRACAARGQAKGCSKPKPRALRGTMTIDGRRGKNATTLRRWKGRKLAPGSYRLVVTSGAQEAKATFTLRGRR